MRNSAKPLLRRPTALLGGAVLLGLSLVFTLTGCGNKVSEEPTDTIKLNHTISEASQAAIEPDAFARLFAEGVEVPEADREKYTSYSFFAYEADISGDTAVATVTVFDENDTKTELEWTLVCQDGIWKLKTAPLP